MMLCMLFTVGSAAALMYCSRGTLGTVPKGLLRALLLPLLGMMYLGLPRALRLKPVHLVAVSTLPPLVAVPLLPPLVAVLLLPPLVAASTLPPLVAASRLSPLSAVCLLQLLPPLVRARALVTGVVVPLAWLMLTVVVNWPPERLRVTGPVKWAALVVFVVMVTESTGCCVCERFDRLEGRS